MKAIRVHYVGPSECRGSRIIADDGDGHRIVMPYDHALNLDELYKAAAYALRDKMQWEGEMVGGGYKNAEYFVFV
jgi:hypothetical protein